MLMDHAWIARRIPHDGAMCLLDRVLDWDATRVRCAADSHRRPDNPLRAQGCLRAVCGIEYAAQAMAVHGALLISGESPERAAGHLVSVRDIRISARRLDDVEADLVADAERLGGDERTVLYRFEVKAGERLLLSGRAAILTRPGAPAR